MRTHKKTLVLFCLVSIVASLLCGCTSRADFNIPYNPEAVASFVEKVCDNYDGEYAKLIDPNYNGPAFGSCYTAKIETKLPGAVEEEVQMRFYNKGDSDRVRMGEIIFYRDDSQNEMNCKLALICALEKTLCGEAQIIHAVPNYSVLRSFAASADDDSTFAEYMLTDDLSVRIYTDASFGHDWYVFYRIESRNFADR